MFIWNKKKLWVVYGALLMTGAIRRRLLKCCRGLKIFISIQLRSHWFPKSQLMKQHVEKPNRRFKKLPKYISDAYKWVFSLKNNIFYGVWGSIICEAQEMMRKQPLSNRMLGSFHKIWHTWERMVKIKLTELFFWYTEKWQESGLTKVPVSRDSPASFAHARRRSLSDGSF